MTRATIFVSIANNHSLDYGVQGLNATEQFLAKTGLVFTQRDKSVTKKGVTFLSATDHCGCDNLGKWGENVWVIDYNNLEPVLRKIRRIRQTAPLRGAPSGLIVLSINWGSNWVTRIPPKIKQLGRALIDAGVNVVFGHSAHHIPPEPVEFYNGGLIIYGLGDFVNDYAIKPDFRSDEALMCTISSAGSAKRSPFGADDVPFDLFLKPTASRNPEMAMRVARPPSAVWNKDCLECWLEYFQSQHDARSVGRVVLVPVARRAGVPERLSVDVYDFLRRHRSADPPSGGAREYARSAKTRVAPRRA